MPTSSMRLDQPIGAFVRRLREQSGLSQTELAARVGTTQSAVSRWEHGRDEPRVSTLASIVRACGLTASIVADVDVDRAQIRAHLALSPVERLQAAANVSRLRATVRQIATS